MTVTLAGGLVNPCINYHIFGGTGSISPVVHQGTGPDKAVTVTGNPQGIFQGFEIVITTGGPLGSAVFNYKYWYFDSYITDQTTAADFIPIAGTGITIHFADATYVANDIYTFNISPPVIFSASPGKPLNIKWFGAVGDFNADDTAALQTAIGVARGFFNLAVSDLYFPIGSYKITNTLYAQTWTVGAPLRFIGEYYGNNVGVATIGWAGPDDVPMWVMWNQTNGMMEHLRFSATSSVSGSIVHAARNCVLLTENPTQTDGGSATDTYVFRDCQFVGAAGTGSANVLLGNGTPYDVSQVYFEHCRFDTAEDGLHAEQTNYNVAFDGGGNTKDFFLTDCQFFGCKLAHVYANMNGVLNITNGVGGSNSVPSQHGCQLASFYIVTCEQAIVNGWESEGDARLLYCEASGFNHTSILLKAVNWNGDSADSSSLAAPSPTLRTTVASGSAGASLPQPTIQVASTFIAKSSVYTFPAAGTILVLTSDGLQTVTYTGITPTSFTGCSGGTGVLSTGNPVFVARVTSFAQLDVAVVALCTLSIEGSSLRNDRLGSLPVTTLSNIMVSADAFRSTSGAFYSCGNFYEASTVLPAITTNGINLITSGFYRVQDLNITSRNDFGSSPITGQLFRLPAYEGRDLQNGRQQLLNENAGAVAIVTSGNLAHSVARFDLDSTQALVGQPHLELGLGTLPNRSRIINVVCKTTQGWSGLGLGNVTLSIGDAVDFTNYVLPKDITIPREAGTLATDLGPLLNASANLAYGHLTNSSPVVLGSTLLYAQILARSGNLSSLNGGHTEIHITFEVLPGEPVFLASDIPDCKLWLRSDMGVTVGGSTSTVPEWDDMSGGGNNFGQSITADQPSYVLRAYQGADGIFRPAVRGSSTALLTDAGFSLSQLSEITLVYVLSKSSLPGCVYAAYDSSHTVLYGGSAGHDLAWLNGSDNDGIAASGTLQAGPHLIIINQSDSAKALSAYLDYNENQVFSKPPSSDIAGPPRNLFAQSDDGDMLEVMVFSRVLSPNERFAIMNYARTTWLIPIRS